MPPTVPYVIAKTIIHITVDIINAIALSINTSLNQKLDDELWRNWMRRY